MYICADISTNGRYMIQNIIFDNDNFAPLHHFRIILTKVPPCRFLAKMFIFVLVPGNLIMSKAQRKSIFDHSSHRLSLVFLNKYSFLYFLSY